MKYHACYCEENIWHLCVEPSLQKMERKVVWVSSDHQICPLWRQRAAVRFDEPVCWDYHVFLLTKSSGEQWRVWDFDTMLGTPVGCAEYVKETFRPPIRIQPVFRIMDCAYYRNTFASDRSHMKNVDGTWLAEPPEWRPIVKAELSFADMLDMHSHKHGELVSLVELARRYC